MGFPHFPNIDIRILIFLNSKHYHGSICSCGIDKERKVWVMWIILTHPIDVALNRYHVIRLRGSGPYELLMKL